LFDNTEMPLNQSAVKWIRQKLFVWKAYRIRAHTCDWNL